MVDESALTGRAAAGERLAAAAPFASGTANAGEAFELRASRPGGAERLRRARAAGAARRRRSGRRSSAWQTATRSSSCRSRWPSPGSPGGCQRRPGAGARRPRRRDALPADPRRADRAPVRGLPGGEGRGDRQGIERDRGARRGPNRAPRQDRDAHARHAGGRPLVPLDALSGEELLRLAASLDQLSAHSLADALVQAAHERAPT